MKKIIFAIFLGLIFANCGPQKRFTKLVEKHPWLLTTDTVTIHDTIRLTVPKIEVDTAFIFSKIYDTITIEKDRFKTKIWTVHDSIFVNGQCDSIVIEKIIERKIPVKYYEKKRFNWWLILLPLFVILGILIYRRNEKI